MQIPKQVREVLTEKQYIRRKREVLTRDNWACTNPLCRSRRDLSVHHIVSRSKGRNDSLLNLVSLCINCHSAAHAHKLKISYNEKLGKPEFFVQSPSLTQKVEWKKI